MKRNTISEINAGSMADIAFLLLIFFLVTTTLNKDEGIFSKIPKKNPDTTLETHKKNVFSIIINRKNEIYNNGNIVALSQISELAMNFIDNGGGLDIKGKPCDWCRGKKLSTLSDHPTKAIISIETDRETSYETYMSVLNEVHLAYNKLRNKLAKDSFGIAFSELETTYKKTKNQSTLKKLRAVQQKYPMLIGDMVMSSSMAKK